MLVLCEDLCAVGRGLGDRGMACFEHGCLIATAATGVLESRKLYCISCKKPLKLLQSTLKNSIKVIQWSFITYTCMYVCEQYTFINASSIKRFPHKDDRKEINAQAFR